jgi:uncharacterized RDD family membrane protein YckC
MEDNYYIAHDNTEEGPFTLEQLMQGDLDADTLVLAPNATDWQRASDLPELFHYFEAMGYYFPTEDNLAGFGWRLAAYVVDSFIMSYPIAFFKPENFNEIYQRALNGGATVTDLDTMLKFNLTTFLIMAIYHAICEFSPLQGSLGKKFFRLTVVDADGRRLSFLKALTRNIGKIVSGTALFIGYLWVLWDSRKQAWHDKWAKAYVLVRNR